MEATMDRHRRQAVHQPFCTVSETTSPLPFFSSLPATSLGAIWPARRSARCMVPKDGLDWRVYVRRFRIGESRGAAGFSLKINSDQSNASDLVRFASAVLAEP